MQLPMWGGVAEPRRSSDIAAQCQLSPLAGLGYGDAAPTTFQRFRPGTGLTASSRLSGGFVDFDEKAVTTGRPWS